MEGNIVLLWQNMLRANLQGKMMILRENVNMVDFMSFNTFCHCYY